MLRVYFQYRAQDPHFPVPIPSSVLQPGVETQSKLRRFLGKNNQSRYLSQIAKLG